MELSILERDEERGREKNLEHRRLERPVADGALQNLQFDLDSGGRHPPCRRPADTVVFLLHSSSLCLLLGLVRVLHTCLVSDTYKKTNGGHAKIFIAH
jgi:hypothetical protein